MSEKAAGPSTTPASCSRVSLTVKNVGRLFVKADAMPSLAMVLSGDTCYPISLQNFEAYLIHKEFSVELLQFIVWFQDYRRRFLKLPAATQAVSPGHSHFSFAIPCPARTAERLRASMARADAVQYVDGAPLAVDQPPLMSTSTSTASKSGSRTPLTLIDTVLPRADYVPSLYNRSLAGAGSLSDSPSVSKACLEVPQVASTRHARPWDQPFREECLRIVATFLTPGAAKELPLDPVVRDTVIRELTWNTHPDIFLPVYEEMYYTLETISLSRFLGAASANINRPKQLMWYTMGAVDTAIGVLLAILLIAIVPIPPAANRAWRLFSVLPTAVGLSTIYSAYRGFCSQVWGRTTTQLHEWELEEMDAETGAHWDKLLAQQDEASSHPPSLSSTTGSSRKSTLQERKPPESWGERTATDPVQCDAVTSADSSAIAPFNEEPPRLDDPVTKPDVDVVCRDGCRAYPTPFLSIFTRLIPSQFLCASKDTPSSSPLPDVDVEKARVTAYGGKRSPFFGPEKIVLDPRIRTLHNAVMRDLVCFFIIVTLAFSALVLSVPDGRR